MRRLVRWSVVALLAAAVLTFGLSAVAAPGASAAGPTASLTGNISWD